jgi:hypothetical protein
VTLTWCNRKSHFTGPTTTHVLGTQCQRINLTVPAGAYIETSAGSFGDLYLQGVARTAGLTDT